VILVAGGSGRLGSQLVRLLAARGERVRVLSRAAARVDTRFAEAAIGDVRDAAAVARAMQGVRAVVAAAHGFAGKGVDPQSVDGIGNAHLMQAAELHGVEHFVLVSIAGATADHPIELFRCKHAAEQQLRASRLAWTIVRASAFVETWAALLGEPLLRTGKTVLFGRCDNPLNFVSVHDVARVIDLALREPALRGRCIDVLGPENLSFKEFVATFEAVTGVAGTKRQVPLPVLRALAWLLRPIHPGIARQIAAAVVMDSTDMSVNSSDLPLPSLPRTSVAAALRRDYARA
jgi:uncharacterized protein YbjT (DUF2867 family)